MADFISKVTLPNSSNYPIRASAIPYGEVDATSTSTAFTATVPGIYELENGVCMFLRNGQITSASGFTINVNGLGDKPVYNNMTTGSDRADPATVATRDTTIFNVAYTMFFVYSTEPNINSGNGGWICYRGYNSDTNTVGYQLRTNSTTLKTYDKTRYYRMFFTSADGTHWVPANTGTDNSATSSKTVNQRPINPFGRIIYYSANTSFAAESGVNATYCWDQYAFALGYSFNRTGAALTLTTQTPVYLKCAPQADGSAIMDSTTPIVQALPSTEDGKIYIFLGIAYSATNIELIPNHPVYYYKDNAIRLWTSAAAVSTIEPATANPIVNGTAAVGTSVKYAREDHVHPTDTSRQATLVSGTNIKTINNNSLLGSGDISITPTALTAAEVLSAVETGWGQGYSNADNTEY